MTTSKPPSRAFTTPGSAPGTAGIRHKLEVAAVLTPWPSTSRRGTRPAAFGFVSLAGAIESNVRWPSEPAPPSHWRRPAICTSSARTSSSTHPCSSRDTPRLPADARAAAGSSGPRGRPGFAPAPLSGRVEVKHTLVQHNRAIDHRAPLDREAAPSVRRYRSHHRSRSPSESPEYFGWRKPPRMLPVK